MLVFVNAHLVLICNNCFTFYFKVSFKVSHTMFILGIGDVLNMKFNKYFI